MMKQVIKLAGGKRKELTWSAVLAAAGSLLSIVPWIVIYELIRYYLQEAGDASGKYAEKLILWALAAVAVRYLLVISSFLLSHIAAFDLLYRIRSRITEHLGKLPMGYWNGRNTGFVRKVIQEDVELIENSIAHHIPDFVNGLVVPLATLGYLYFVDWRMAIAATIPLILGMLLVKGMYSGVQLSPGKKYNSKEIMRQYHDSLEEMHSRTVEYVRGMPVVKVFNLTVESFSRLKSSITRYGHLAEKWSRHGTPFWAGFTAIVLGGGVFILPVAIRLLASGQTDVPTVIMFLLLGTGCFAGMVGFIMITGSVMMINEGASRISAILETPPMAEPESPELPLNFTVAAENVSFRYGPELPYVLKDVSLEIKQGELVALVGPSGAGKSTLAQVLARMWDVTSGRITIGAKDVRDIGSEGVNEIVGTVFQDVQMLTDTVEANIRMGESEKTAEEVIKAAEAASVNELIETLPKGYETVIGEGGEVHLSGGEKQRISLARIFLRKFPIVILDEATAYADAENEARVQQAFSMVTEGKTVVVIAHRLSTVRNADRIVVLDKGRIVQQGTHEQLLVEGGLYRRMWNAHKRAGKWAFNEVPAVEGAV
ncbi:hypothetical protein CSA37_08705 [Candidatus Fermentibacteria bacterium]|nr:MAG: hypothetical protein CSA37_08705 [Candidatus Fermentibacteria bacterium]